MVRRVTPQQAARVLKKAERDRQTAIRNYNSEAKKYNTEVKRYNRQQSTQASRLDSAIKAYNREARKANANRTVRIELRESSQAVYNRFAQIEEVADARFGELAANDAANSIEALDLFESNEVDPRAATNLQLNLRTSFAQYQRTCSIAGKGRFTPLIPTIPTQLGISAPVRVKLLSK